MKRLVLAAALCAATLARADTGWYLYMYDPSFDPGILIQTGSGLVIDPVAKTLTATGTAQVNSDWNASSGAAQILNKPSLATVATSGSYTDLSNRPAARSFSYTTRSLNSCFQVSSTRDALVNYAVDVTTTLTLTNGAQGTVILRTYTDSGCTTGGQTITSGTSGLPTTLSVTVGLQNLGTVVLAGVVPAGLYVRQETANTIGTPTFAARASQEVLL